MRIKTIWALPVFLLALSAPIFAQGIIIPEPPRPCPPECPPRPRPFPIPRVLKIKSIHITAKIANQVATTRVVQVFSNESSFRLQGTYFFPIPESASVTEFAMYDGDRKLTGEVMARDKARQIYNEIVRKALDPALLEYAGKDLFSASVFPIEPHSDKKIELTYTQVLKNEGGVVAYRYPLGSGRRLQETAIGTIAASVVITSPVDIRNIYSPSHNISVKRDGERQASLSFETAGDAGHQDFQLFYGLSERDFGINVLTYREPGKPGYFLLLISPKLDVTERDRIAKDIVFVIDTSGSMSGEKIKQAKEALKFGIQSLGKDDRFNVVSFSGEDHLLERTMLDASEFNRKRATEFVDALAANGGTNIDGALTTALSQFSAGDRPAMLVFLTDGQPTVGETTPEKIVERVRNARTSNLRLFTFGIGYDVNAQLLDAMASTARGAADYVEPSENLETRVSNFFDKIHFPVLSDLTIDYGRAESDLVYPRELPDLFRGAQITVLGRYSNAGEVRDAVIRLRGKIKGREHVIEYGGLRFPESSTENDFLPRLWATRRVGFLMSEIRAHGENKELVDEIVELGTRYGIVTPYTSYLITADDLKARGGRDSGPVQPMFFSQLDSAGNASAALSSAPSKGEQAVVLNKRLRAVREAEQVARFDGSRLKAVRDKTFILRDGVWTDSAYKQGLNLPVVELKFGSEEYFKAVIADSLLAEFVSLGQQVVVVYKGKVIKVTA